MQCVAMKPEPPAILSPRWRPSPIASTRNRRPGSGSSPRRCSFRTTVAGPALRTHRGGAPRQARDFIHDHLNQSLSLTQLAAQAQCDVRSFTRWFKAEFGMPAHRYVMAARVERARSLLLGSQRSLAEIALLCGFNTQSHMTTVFRRFVGVTPGTFRAAPRSAPSRAEAHGCAFAHVAVHAGPARGRRRGGFDSRRFHVKLPAAVSRAPCCRGDVVCIWGPNRAPWE